MKKVDNYFLKCFGDNLRSIRKQKKITQEQLANDVNIEISQISRIERGVVNTSISNVHLIATALHIETKKMFDF